MDSENPFARTPSAKVEMGAPAEPETAPPERLEADPIVDRREAREFSKEHSQFYRDRLAAQINLDRRHLAAFLKGKKEEISKAEGYREKKIEQLTSQLEGAENEHAGQVERSKKFEEFQNEVAALESVLESIKASFWKRLFGKSRIAELEAQKRALLARGDGITEPDRAGILRLSLEAAKLKAQLAEEERSTATNERVAEIREHAFFVQDGYVSKSKDLIKDFYRKNLEIRREDAENPLARDVAENCRTHGVLLRHGVPDDGVAMIDDWSGNNSVIDTNKLNAGQRLLFAAAIEPALSTHTAHETSMERGHLQQGFIVGAGEITAASKTDLFSYASGLDERNPKYDQDLVSSRAPNIQEGFAKAVNEVGADNMRAWNEIIVEHPKFSAIYVVDNGSYGQRTEEGHNKFYNRSKWALEQAKVLGMPAVVILKSGKIFNLATDEEVSQEDLLSMPVTYSAEEREKMLVAAEHHTATKVESSHTSAEMGARAIALGAGTDDLQMEEYKHLNAQLAQIKLDALESDKNSANERVRLLFKQ